MVEQGEQERTEHWVEAADGARLHIVEQGRKRAEAVPVVLVPGMGQSTALVQLPAAACAGVTRVVSVDQRGVGGSDKTLGPYPLGQVVDDLVRVIEARATRPVVLAGCSFGGIIASELARARPDLLAHLVLVAAAAPGPDPEPASPEMQQARRREAELAEPEATRYFLPYAFAPDWPHDNPERYEDFLRLHLDQPAGTAGQAAAREEYRQRQRPGPATGTPAHIVHGTEDRLVPFAHAALLAEGFEHAEVVPMNTCGHLCWLERPHVLNRLLVALATHADTAGLAV